MLALRSSNLNASGVGGNGGASALVPPPPDPTVLAEKIVKNLFNYVSGFVPGAGNGKVTPDSVVAMGVIAKWYEKFLAKAKAGGIGFLDNEE